MTLLETLLAQDPPLSRAAMCRTALVTREQLVRTHLVVGQALDSITRVLTAEMVHRGHLTFTLHYGAINTRTSQKWKWEIHGSLPADLSTGSAMLYVMATVGRYRP